MKSQERFLFILFSTKLLSRRAFPESMMIARQYGFSSSYLSYIHGPSKRLFYYIVMIVQN